MNKNTFKAKKLLDTFFSQIVKSGSWNFDADVYTNLDTAIITSKDNISSKTKNKLKPILSRFLKA